MLCVVAGYLIISGGMGTKQLVYAYEKKQYNKAIYTGELFAKDLCLEWRYRDVWCSGHFHV